VSCTLVDFKATYWPNWTSTSFPFINITGFDETYFVYSICLLSFVLNVTLL
jgi:hypothetical protein